MTLLPIIAVDVDGVLNPGGAPEHARSRDWLDRSPYQRRRFTLYDHRSRSHESYNVWLDRNHGRKLRQIATATDAELTWCTSWMGQANTSGLGAYLRLPELPVINVGLNLDHKPRWKFDAVTAYAADRPLVWFDDEFGDHLVARAAFLIARQDTPTLLREVNPKVGLTDDDLDAAHRFLEALT